MFAEIFINMSLICVKLLILGMFISQAFIMMFYHYICVDFTKRKVFIYLTAASLIHSIASLLFSLSHPILNFIFISIHLFSIILYIAYPFINRVAQAKQILEYQQLIEYDEQVDQAIQILTKIHFKNQNFLLLIIVRLAFGLMTIMAFLCCFLNFNDFFNSALISIPILFIILAILLIILGLSVIFFEFQKQHGQIANILSLIDREYVEFQINNKDNCRYFEDGSVSQACLILTSHFIFIFLAAVTATISFAQVDFASFITTLGLNITFLSQMLLL